ncbi:hypothetical protein [Nevskia sp.]|uniref:hypothetical protein n=1 Tax=Nevskia sp. TaxID=1929292 RepID=UPI0025CB8016|nr:hypothetical protein [Nevskia sp.]
MIAALFPRPPMNRTQAPTSHRSTRRSAVSVRHVIAFAVAAVINAGAILGAAQLETRGERAYAARAVASLTQVAAIKPDAASGTVKLAAKPVARG